MMFGSMSVSRIRFQSDISTVVTSASAVWSTMPFGSVFIPSISFSSVGRSGATTSTTFWSSASLGGQVRGLAHRLLGPVRVPAVGLGERRE